MCFLFKNIEFSVLILMNHIWGFLVSGRLNKGRIATYLTTLCSSMSSSTSLSASWPEKQAEQVDRILAGRNDDHGGVIVEMTKEPMDPSLFLTLLRASISQWRQQVIIIPFFFISRDFINYFIFVCFF